jgi:hypothetical protein
MAGSKATARSRLSGTVESMVRAAGTDKDDAVKKRADDLGRRMIEDYFSVGRPSAAIRLLAYGATKVGKTTFLRQAPKVVFLPIEEGANQYAVPQWKKAIRRLDDYREAIFTLRHGKHDFASVAIDTLDALEALMKIELEGKLREVARQTKEGGPTTLTALNEEEYAAGHDLIKEMWGGVLHDLDDLRDVRGMHVLFAAHPHRETVRVLDGETDYARLSPAFMYRKAANLCKAWFDYILFFQTEVLVSTGRQNRVSATAGDRFMHCTQTATIDAGCRGALPWPERMPLHESTGFSDFMAMRRAIDTLGDRGRDALLERGAAIAARLPAERREACLKKLRETIAARDYVFGERVLVVAAEEAAEVARAAGGGAEAPKSNGASVADAAALTPAAAPEGAS